MSRLLSTTLAIMLASVRSVAELVAVQARGQRVKFLFFWGHKPERDGSVGAGRLSQWWPAPFTVDGLVFATAGHYMMWRKATLFGDDATAERILAAPHPHAAKALGGRVAGFDQPPGTNSVSRSWWPAECADEPS